ncbi:MAG TPA: PLP-dependent transferase, partial [Saprospiraceae bacterium]|nr:PLP-dependent transferase [Saprospiraceae bacterium]
GGLMSFFIKADTIEKAEQFFNALKCFQLAVSWGGHESLIMPMVAFYNVEGRDQPATPWNMVRIYIGLEDPEWLIEDIKQALELM